MKLKMGLLYWEILWYDFLIKLESMVNYGKLIINYKRSTGGYNETL